jgi:excisionase family DNA binding protein
MTTIYDINHKTKPGGSRYIASPALDQESKTMNQQDFDGTPRGAFSVRDFCEWAGIGRTMLYEEIKTGRLAAKKFGRRTIIPRTEAERWLQDLPALQRG